MPKLFLSYLSLGLPLGLALVASPGCSSSELPEHQKRNSSHTTSVSPVDGEKLSEQQEPSDVEPRLAADEATVDLDAVTVELIDGPGFEALLEQHEGRVVLVDFWAPWCLSCVKQLPHTVELYEEHGDQGLSVVTICLDDPEKKSQILDVLRAKEATTDNYISRHGGSAKSMELFNIEGGLPHYQLYNREGKLHRTFATGQENINVEAITQAVESLVEQ